MNKKEKRKKRIGKIFISFAVSCSLLLAVALPSFALSSGSSDTLDPTLLVPEFPSAVIEQRYTNNEGVTYTYYNDYNMPIDFPNDMGGGSASGNTYIAPVANGVVKNAIIVSYNYGVMGADGFYNRCRYGFDLTLTNPNWGNAIAGRPIIKYHLGSYTDEELNVVNQGNEYDIQLDVVVDTRYDYESLFIDDLYMKYTVSYKYDKISNSNGNVSTETVTYDMFLPSDLKSYYGPDYPYHAIYSLHSIDACYTAEFEISKINAELSSLYKPVYSIYDYSISIGGQLSTSVNGNDVIPITAYRDFHIRLRSNYVVSSMDPLADKKSNPIVLTGSPTYIDNDFNPIDWVINVGGSFLNMPLFNTASGVSVTIGLIFGSIVVCFAVVVILKIYWGG